MRRLCGCLLAVAAIDSAVGATQSSRPAPLRSSSQPASISGTVVRMHDGGPVRFASVAVESPDGAVHRTTAADAMGRFAVTDLAPGRYAVRASAAGYVPGSSSKAGASRGHTLVDLAAERQAEVRIVLARGGVITGRVVDGDGAPVEGVPVHALAAEYRNGREQLRQATARPRTTDDRGAYRLFGLEPGDYYVAAIPGPFGDQPGGSLAGHPLTYLPGTVSAADAVTATVTADRESAVGDLVVRPATTAVITGVVIDAHGAPGASAELVLLPASGPMSSVLPRTTSDAAGRFAFANVPEGQYLLQNLPAPATTSEFGVTTVSVPGDATHVLRLQAAASRRGTVEFEDGAPDFSARRLLVMLQAANHAQSPLSRGGRAKVLDDWTLELTNIWGPHFVRVPEPPPGWMLRHVYLGTEDVVDQPIDFSRADTSAIRVVLTRRGATLAGTVHDDSREPAAGETVLIYSADARRWLHDERAIQWTRTDGAGHYQSRGMPDGDYLVAAVENWTVRDWPPRPARLESLRPLASTVTMSEGVHYTKDLSLVAAPK